ncbi:response regulator [Inhella gelatinilytica]|uniref:histidine kinase n=1 Tax=Inhella gelatinilytica TaxID=2795030 RepID=A0A931IVQ7_9BURK|nr:response regulator [Inhella gelatinilytica]MBH9553705.1 response regulator [Inhella gelatinilytica]
MASPSALEQHRQELDDAMRGGLRVALVGVAIGGAAQGLAGWWDSSLNSLPFWRLALLSFSGFFVSACCLLALRQLRARGVSAAAATFALSILPVLLASPWLSGDGLADANLPALGVPILVLALLVSPRAGWRALAVAVAGLVVVGVAHWVGWIEGPQPQRSAPFPVVALGHLLPLLVGGWVAMHYAEVFWHTLRRIEDSRQVTAAALADQQQATAALSAAEEHQRALLDATLTSILIFDVQSRALVLANPQALRRFDATALDELAQDCLFPGGPYDRETARLHFEKTLREGPQYFLWSTVNRHGKRQFWDIKTEQIPYKQRPAVVVFGHDISEQVAARSELARAREVLEEQVTARTLELEQARDRAEQLARSKSDFLAQLGHEVRGPMNTVLGLAHQVLSEADTPPQTRRSLERIHEASAKLLAAVNDAMGFARIAPVAPSEAGFAPSEPLPPTPAQTQPLQGLRALVVDDVPINREILCEMLLQLGARAHAVDSGAAALDWIQREGATAVDVVLMDIQMPDMDGYETTQHLHARHPSLQVMALTANALPEQRAASAAAGMCGHVTKPVEMGELIQALQGLRAPAPAKSAEPAAGTGPTTPPAPAPSSTTELVWDRAGALARCANKASLLRRLLGNFVEQYRREGLPADESARVAWTHRLKGTSANLGLVSLSAAAAAYERELRGDAAAAQGPAPLEALMERQFAELDLWLATQSEEA